ncbi:MAG: hypothetical protein ACU0GG_12515 [Paracoccaceae bacterium]
MGMVVAAVVPVQRFRRVSFVLGCGAPDFFIICLFSFVALNSFVENGASVDQTIASFSALYFDDPFCIAAHNLLHSPLSITLLAIGASVLATGVMYDRICSFLLGASFHAIVDIAVHYDDGPLFLWPVNWSLRFQSPISHWDANHFGAYVLALEAAALLVLVLIVAKADPWRTLGWVTRFFGSDQTKEEGGAP